MQLFFYSNSTDVAPGRNGEAAIGLAGIAWPSLFTISFATRSFTRRDVERLNGGEELSTIFTFADCALGLNIGGVAATRVVTLLAGDAGALEFAQFVSQIFLDCHVISWTKYEREGNQVLEVVCFNDLKCCLVIFIAELCGITVQSVSKCLKEREGYFSEAQAMQCCNNSIILAGKLAKSGFKFCSFFKL